MAPAQQERSVGPRDISRALGKRSFSLRAVLAELIGMAFFVYAGCGTAIFFSSTRVSEFALATETTDQGLAGELTAQMQTSIIMKAVGDAVTILTVNSSWGVITALAFGCGIMVLAYSIGHVSGCHLNAAVTISLMLSGNCALIQGIANICAQLVGSLLAAGLLYGTVPAPGESSLGSNVLSNGFSKFEACLGEAVMTCFLCFVVHMTAVDVRSVGNKGFAPMAIGFTVVLGHAVLLPVDGCSINPSRSFGPAAISGTWTNFWIFVVGPIVGGIIAGPLWWVCTQPAMTFADMEPEEEFGAGRPIPSSRELNGAKEAAADVI